MEKRGLSTVVTYLIIILLVLVAVGIIWVVLKNVISGGAEQISLGKFTVDLEIKQVVIDNSTNNLSIIIKRNPGAGDVTGITFVVSDGVNSEIFEEDVVLKELGERSFIFTLSELDVSDIKTVSIYPLLGAEQSLGNVADVYQVKESNGNDGTSPQDCAADLGGTCCSTGQICQGGSFQLSSDCNNLCCVGGSCETGCTPETCGSLGYNCGTWDDGCGGTLNCGTCNSTADCINGVCIFNETKFIINLGAISWWRFEGNALDEIGGNDGTINGANCNADGKYGQACGFDGENDYIDCGNNSNLAPPDEITITAWIKPLQLEISQRIVSKFYQYEMELGSTNNLIFRCKIGGTPYTETSTETIAKDVWTYVGVSFNGTYMKFYINGIQIREVSHPGIMTIDAKKLFIGGAGIQYNFNGSIDEVMIFNRDLSEDEVQALYELDLS